MSCVAQITVKGLSKHASIHKGDVESSCVKPEMSQGKQRN